MRTQIVETAQIQDHGQVSDEPKKPAGRPFQKGVSGNPGGREKGAKGRARDALARREYTAADGQTYTGTNIALHVLIDIATNLKEKARDRSDAASKLLDRAEGRPDQRVDVAGDLTIGGPAAVMAPLTAEQLEALAVLDEGLGDDAGDHG